MNIELLQEKIPKADIDNGIFLFRSRR